MEVPAIGVVKSCDIGSATCLGSRYDPKWKPPLAPTPMSMCGYMTKEDKVKWARDNLAADQASAEAWKKEQEEKTGAQTWWQNCVAAVCAHVRKINVVQVLSFQGAKSRAPRLP